MINGSLFIIATSDQRTQLKSEGETLKTGKVQFRIFLDPDNRLRAEPTLLLHNQNLDAMAVVEARFAKGFMNADMVEAIQIPSED